MCLLALKDFYYLHQHFSHTAVKPKILSSSFLNSDEYELLQSFGSYFFYDYNPTNEY